MIPYLNKRYFFNILTSHIIPSLNTGHSHERFFNAKFKR